MKKTITLSIASILALGLMSFGVLDADGSKTGRTTTGCSCHGTSSPPTVTLSFSPALSATNSYAPNTLYTVTATVAKTGELNAGLDLAASAGTLAGGSNTQLLSGEITHTGSGNTTTTGSVALNFQWTSPASSITSVTFNYAGVGSNNNNATSGDSYSVGSATIALSGIGISEKAESNLNFSVFPNPVNESANVTYVLAENSTISANLINVSGQVVTTFFKDEEQTAGKQNRKLMIDPSITKGIYFVAINVNGKNSYSKIVVD